MKKYNIGIYGISGSGKSTLIRSLSKKTSTMQAFEGSKILENIFGEDISNFKLLNDKEKYKIREETISFIHKNSIAEKHTIVDCHYSFIKSDNDFDIAMTKADKNFFTHIFYLDIKDNLIKQQQIKDKTRKRDFSIKDIQRWKEFEKVELQKICEDNNIKFHKISSHDLSIDYVQEVINKENLSSDLEIYIDTQMNDKYILFDADQTIVNFDTAKKYVYKILNIDEKDVKSCFEQDGYCFSSFLKLSTLHSKINNKEFINSMKKVASEIEIESDFLDLMKIGYSNYNICIVTAGFKLLWEEVLQKYNLENIKVFGGNNLNIDNYIIDNNLKGFISTHLQNKGKHVMAFGDSALDKDMLVNSNKGYLVIRHKVRADVVNILSRHKHIKYLSMNSLTTKHLEKSNFNEIKRELTCK